MHLILTPIVLLWTLFQGPMQPNKKIEVVSKPKVTQSSSVNKDREKIKAFVKTIQPKYSQERVNIIVEAIFAASKKFKLDPYVIASTAYVESEFKMTSKPCIGIMQLVKSSIRYYDPKKLYNPYTIYGNIFIGSLELSYHLKKYSRNNLPSRTAYRNMYRSYNGSYMKNKYSIKTMLVQSRLKNLSIEALKLKLKKGPIWK
jgi:hypothetical protein